MSNVTSLASARGTPPAQRAASAKVDKISARRIELAEATLETLAELGYARTSLREIAQNSEFSHGVLHYYFNDKIDLICCGVRHYKARCVTRYDDLLTTAMTREALLDGFCLKLAESLTAESKMHRLWYDLRSQALFEDAFRADVKVIDANLEDMVWRVATHYAKMDGKEVTVTKSALYALFDGLFQKHLLLYLSGDESAVSSLIEEVRRLMPMVA
jgi:AcrR family transcriptional regulator